ncbi:MAG: hypothetical protein L0Y58_00045 [Verrucomicrobia subdivision 3 bacterium]|nr:hypothetical protein [Limisphaerales bacterium]
MEGTLSRSELRNRRNSRIRFELADESDDADIRHLLRNNPMAGKIELSLEREPSFFADANLPGEEKQTIIAREDNRVVCVGTCSVRSRFVAAEPRRVGYLGGLRLDRSVAGRFDILRRGYEFFRALQAANPADLYFTSIAADNERARKFLERGLPGMPRYDFLAEFVTLLLSVEPVPRSKTNQKFSFGGGAGAPSLDEICEVLNKEGRHDELAPCWSVEQLSALELLGLSQNDFQVARNGEQIVACAALWDQRKFKQTVVRGYAPWLSRWRAAINLMASIAHQPRWPVPGRALAHAFVSHLAMPANEPDALTAMVSAVSAVARRRKIELLTLGFAANDPRLATVRAHFPHREYRSRIYLVHWPEAIGTAPKLAGYLAPEAALL